jgi:crotonobetainyl-CoA:carnitine CoA-transferase CaiB-like acyl-CoA transferase
MRPLEGIRILDLTRLIPGPFASMVLCDLGAQVDKIEDPGAGDYLRYVPPQRAGAAIAFHALNRGKRSAVLDLKKPEGRAAFERLVAGYDVLFEQFRPGVLERLGLGHAELRARHPRLIVCALTGYGRSGPLSGRAGHDINYLARSGVLAAQGPGDAQPQLPGFQLADVSGGMWCVIAILAALRERDQSGQGKICDIAMTDGVLGFATLTIASALAGEPPPRGGEVLTGGIAPYGSYLSKDGVPMTLGALEPKFWFAFAGAVGLDADPTALIPGDHQPELKRRVAEVFAARTAEQWSAFASEHDCCVEPATRDPWSEPQLQARRMFFETTAQGETLRLFRTPVSPTDDTPAPAPRAGEHTRVILREAGLSDEEIDRLVAAGAAVIA